MLRRNWKIFFVGISQGVDIVAIMLSAAVVTLVLYLFEVLFHSSTPALIGGVILYAVSYMTISSMMGLHRGSFHLNLRLQNLLMAKSFVLSFLVSVTIMALIKDFYIDRKPLALFLGFTIHFLFLGRWALRGLNLFFQKKGYGVHNTLVVGYNNEVNDIVSRFALYPELGYKVKGIIRKKQSETIKADLPQYEVPELPEIIEKENIDRVFIPSADIITNGHSSLKDISKKKGIKLKILSPQSEHLLKVNGIYDIAGITLYSPPRYHVMEAKRIAKRIFDLMVGSVVVLILSPIFFITISLIYIESGRPIFFLQRRASLKGGKEFNFIKFRSMVTNAEELKEELRNKNESDGALFKLRDDPRITSVGRFIRKYSIDELPQLFNVLKGDMSLVGPRPLPIVDFEKMDESNEFWEAIKDRASVLPGMTGLWQISGRSDIRFKEMILLDLYYVENHSLLFDLEILFETVPVVLFGRGAY